MQRARFGVLVNVEMLSNVPANLEDSLLCQTGIFGERVERNYSSFGILTLTTIRRATWLRHLPKKKPGALK